MGVREGCALPGHDAAFRPATGFFSSGCSLPGPETAKLRSPRLGRREGFAGALRGHLAFGLGDDGQDTDGHLVDVRVVGSDERHPLFLEAKQEVGIAAETVELGD